MTEELWHGNCLELMKNIPDKSIDLILADPPYGTTACKWDIIIPFDKLWEQYNRIVKDNTPILLFGNEPFSSFLRISNIKKYRYDWYWQKDKAANFLFGNKMPLKNIEIITCFYSKRPTYNPQKEIRKDGIHRGSFYKNPAKISNNVKEIMGDSWKATGMDSKQNYSGKDYEPDKLLPKQLVYFAKNQRNKVHPTQKPVSLLEYLIKTYTNENDLVLDNCAGSGSTLVAAKNLNRQFIGIEKEEKYYNIALNRLKKV